MVNDDVPNTTKPRKYRIVTQNHTTVKNLVDDPHTNGMPPSRLPALLSKFKCFSFLPQVYDLFKIILLV